MKTVLIAMVDRVTLEVGLAWAAVGRACAATPVLIARTLRADVVLATAREAVGVSDAGVFEPWAFFRVANYSSLNDKGSSSDDMRCE